jgi:outer membrane murein-binding lipoprotein Lpp
MQEEDREFLVKQVSAARKENARLKTELSESAAEIERFHREVI